MFTISQKMLAAKNFLGYNRYAYGEHHPVTDDVGAVKYIDATKQKQISAICQEDDRLWCWLNQWDDQHHEDVIF
jgi:hypothetical protein